MNDNLLLMDRMHGRMGYARVMLTGPGNAMLGITLGLSYKAREMDTRSPGRGALYQGDPVLSFEIHTNTGEKDIWQFFYKCRLLFSLLLPFYPLFTSFTIRVPSLSLSVCTLTTLFCKFRLIGSSANYLSRLDFYAIIQSF